MKKKRDKEMVGVERRELLIRRKDFRTKCEEEKLKGEDVISKVLDVLKEASFKIISSKNMGVLASSRRLVMNSTLFQEALLDFGVDLTLRERKLLEMRYSSLDPPRTGYVDYSTFKAEFIALGAELLMTRRKTDSMDRFLKALSSMGAVPGSPTTHLLADGNDNDRTVDAVNGSPGGGGGRGRGGVSLNEVLASAKPSLVRKAPKRRVPKGGKLTPLGSTVKEAPPEPEPEDFPGHPDISPTVTRIRNDDVRRSFEPTDPRRSFDKSEVGGVRRTSAEIRQTLESFLDADNFGMPIALLGDGSPSAKDLKEDDEGKDKLQPLSVGARAARRTLERAPAASPTHAAPLKLSASAAHNIRRNSNRRVSELIREAQKPGAAPSANNMAANLTEPHAFTSSIAIMNMINTRYAATHIQPSSLPPIPCNPPLSSPLLFSSLLSSSLHCIFTPLPVVTPAAYLSTVSLSIACHPSL
jgi:hypothetical protein